MHLTKILLIAATVNILVLLLGSEYFIRIGFDRRASRKAITGASVNTLPMLKNPNGFIPRTREENKKWVDSVEHKEIYLVSHDGIILHGYEFLNKRKCSNYCICLHGYSGCPEDNSGFAEAFLRMGFNVILPTMRGHGKSGGNYICMGYPERLDIAEFTDYIIKKEKDAKIVVYGISMGAAAAMMYAGEKLPENVKCIIEDCGYCSIHDELKYELSSVFHLPPYPLISIVDKRARKKLGFSIIKEGSCIDAVKRSKTPILFIHGDSDTFVPTKMVYKVYGAANCDKELLIIKGAGHAMSSCEDPKKYWATVENFIRNHMGIDVSHVLE